MPWTRINLHPHCEQFTEAPEQIELYEMQRCNRYGPDASGKGWQIKVNTGWSRIYKGWWIIKDDLGVHTLPDDKYRILYKEAEEVVAGPVSTKDACYLHATAGEWIAMMHACRTGQPRDGKFTEMHQFLDKFREQFDAALDGIETTQEAEAQ